jgi:hypothetical protein
VSTQHIPERWITSSKQVEPFGLTDAVYAAWVKADRPQDPQTFRKGYEAAPKPAAAPAEVVEELYKAHRIIYLLQKQLSTPQKSTYARLAHGMGLIGDDETRESERISVLQRVGATT